MAFTLVSVEETLHPGLLYTVVQAVNCTKLPALIRCNSHCSHAVTYIRVEQKLWISPLSPGAVEVALRVTVTYEKLGWKKKKVKWYRGYFCKKWKDEFTIYNTNLPLGSKPRIIPKLLNQATTDSNQGRHPGLSNTHAGPH